MPKHQPVDQINHQRRQIELGKTLGGDVCQNRKRSSLASGGGGSNLSIADSGNRDVYCSAFRPFMRLQNTFCRHIQRNVIDAIDL